MVRPDGRLTPKVVMPVDLFGQPADYRALAPIAAREGLKLFCDTAQGFGGLLDGARGRGDRRRGGDQLLPRPSRWAVMATAAPVSPMTMD